MIPATTAIDLTSLSDEDYSAIESEAQARGLPLDDAAKQMLREHSRNLQKRARLNPIARLFRFQSVNQE